MKYIINLSSNLFILFVTIASVSCNPSFFSKRDLLQLDQTYCFEKQSNQAFPQILGGSIGDTSFNCVDVAADHSFIILGGTSFSTDIVSSTQSPILVKLNAVNGRVIWHSQVNTLSSATIVAKSLKFCSLQDTSNNYMIAVSENPDMAYLIFDVATGALVKAYYEVDLSTSTVSTGLTPVNVFMDSSNNIYCLASSFTDYISYITKYAFNPTSTTLTATFSKSIGNNLFSQYRISAQMHYGKNYIITAGGVNGKAVIDWQRSDTGAGITNNYFQSSSGTSTQTLSRISIYLDTSTDTINILGFAQLLGASATDFSLIFIKEANFLGQIFSFQKFWYVSTSVVTRCLDISLGSQYGFFIINEPSTGKVYYGNIDVTGSATTISVVQLMISSDPSSFIALTAKILSGGGSVYYGGQTTKIESTIYSTKQGFVMKYPQSGCVNVTLPTTSFSATYDTSFLLGKINDVGNALNVLQDSSFQLYEIPQASSEDLLSIKINDIPEVCKSYQNIGVISSPALSDIVYTLWGSKISLPYPDFTYSVSSYDSKVWIYTSNQVNGSALPAALTFTQLTAGNGFQYEVETSDFNMIGTYQVQILGSLNGLYTKVSSFQLKILDLPEDQKNKAPYFIQDPEDYIEMYANSVKTLNLPSIRDPNSGDNTFLKMGMLTAQNSLPAFFVVSKTKIMIAPKSSDVGSRSYLITLYDDNFQGSLSTKYSLTVKVLSEQQKRDSDIKKQIQDNEGSSNNGTGSSAKPQINATNEDVKINSIDSQGKVSLSVSDNFIKQSGGKNLSEIFDIYTGNGDSTNKITNWTIKIDENGNAEVQLTFDDPEAISMFQDGDLLTIELNKGTFKSIKFVSAIPAQYGPRVDGQLIDTASDTAYAMVSSVLYGSFGLSIIAGSSLQFLWALINTLQLITHTPLFQIPYTQKIFAFLQSFFKIATFDPFESAVYLQMVFGLEDTEDYPAFNSRFDFLGYDTSNFIYLIGPPLLYLLYLTIMSLIYLMIFGSKRRFTWTLKLSNYIQKNFYFDGLLLYFLETCLEAGISAVVNFSAPKIRSFGELLSIVLAFGFSSVYISFAIISPIFLLKHYKNYEGETTQKYLQEIVERLRSDNFWSIFYSSSFVVRRILYIMIVFWLPQYLPFQIHMFVVCNLVYTSYLLAFKPVSQAFGQEVFNELTTLLLSYLMFVYTDFVGEIDPKLTIDNVFVGIFLANVLINLLIILHEVISKYIILIKKIYFKLKHKLYPKDSKTIATQPTTKQGLVKTKAIDLTVINEEINLDEEDNINLQSTNRGFADRTSFQVGLDKTFGSHQRTGIFFQDESDAKRDFERNLRGNREERFQSLKHAVKPPSSRMLSSNNLYDQQVRDALKRYKKHSQPSVEYVDERSSSKRYNNPYSSSDFYNQPVMTSSELSMYNSGENQNSLNSSRVDLLSRSQSHLSMFDNSASRSQEKLSEKKLSINQLSKKFALNQVKPRVDPLKRTSFNSANYERGSALSQMHPVSQLEDIAETVHDEYTRDEISPQTKKFKSSPYNFQILTPQLKDANQEINPILEVVEDFDAFENNSRLQVPSNLAVNHPRALPKFKLQSQQNVKALKPDEKFVIKGQSRRRSSLPYIDQNKSKEQEDERKQIQEQMIKMSMKRRSDMDINEN